MWSTHEPRAVDEGADLGRSAVGGASRDAGLSPTTRHLSAVWDSDRADRVRGRERARHAALAAADWCGLSVDADQSCGRAPRRQLGESAPRREGLSGRVGSHAPETTAADIGLDEIQRGKGQRFWTVLSDVVHSEVMGLRQDRTEAAATALLTEELTGRQRAAITAVCTDMHRPYLNAVGAVLTHAEVVFDKFHVLQHASAALDDVRRQEFFRAGAVMREHGRGKRWLLLRRWKTVRGSKRVELQTLFAANRRLFKAYVLREQLDRLWTYKTRPGVLNFLLGWIGALRWQRLPEMERLGDFLFRHIEGIAAYCDHPVRFGVVESINTTIKAVLRRAGRAEHERERLSRHRDRSRIVGDEDKRDLVRGRAAIRT